MHKQFSDSSEQVYFAPMLPHGWEEALIIETIVMAPWYSDFLWAFKNSS